MTDWRLTSVAPEGTHHLIEGRPLYAARFREVLKYHAPGLAPVRADECAWHIDVDGRPAYTRRFLRTFGFYEGLAAVIDADGWLHVRPDGADLSAARHAWVGNFQGGRCAVRAAGGAYCHIDKMGEPAYLSRWRYAGDFRDDIAAVQREDGLSSHIHPDGRLLHDRWFLDLDVFHKGAARARDERGWTHVDHEGTPLYDRRFAAVEQFYNGQARVEGDGGELLVIDEEGRTLVQLRPPRSSRLQRLSGLMVGVWSTQTIRAAVDLGVTDALPATVEACAEVSGLSPAVALRLLRALWELGLVEPRAGSWRLTDMGELLRTTASGSAADAARVWGGEHYAAWAGCAEALRRERSAFETMFGEPFFERLATRPADLATYQRAMCVYAEHDYAGIAAFLPLGGVTTVVDAGGGSGALLAALLGDVPELRGLLLDRPEVASSVRLPPHLAMRIEVVAGDLFRPWPCTGDLVVLARVLHDWDDDAVVRVLVHAKAALTAGGRIALVEMVLTDDQPNGSLLDLNMLVICGSRERSRADWERVAAAAGLTLRSVAPLPMYGCVLVLAPLGGPDA